MPHGRRGWGHEPPHHLMREFMRLGFGGPPRATGARVRRGDVRYAVLQVLAEQPMHGYEVIRDLEERSGGRWRPSPGSIYPTLQLLEDEGLVKGKDDDGRRVFEITKAGRDALAKRGNDVAPWEEAHDAHPADELRQSAFQLVAAAMQVGSTANAAQVDRTKQILDEARKKIYGILAES